MMKTLLILLMLLAVALSACVTQRTPAGDPVEPESSVRALWEAGKYHEAMRELPKAMHEWNEYTQQTGRTAEGAAGYIYATAMSAIVTNGDRDWGKILDDPDIPYSYKTEMIFEIAEARLGKGASWSPYHTDVVIIPRSKRADSWDEVNALLRQTLSKQGATAEADGSQR